MTEPAAGPEPISRRRYLTIQACRTGVGLWAAVDAVASTAIEHPEWDMDELRTWQEWEQEWEKPR